MLRLLQDRPALRIRLGKFRQQAMLPFWMTFWSIAPRDVLRALPGTSESFGPPRRSADWASYRNRHRLEWRQVYPDTPVDLPAPYFCSREDVRFEPPSPAWPEAGVAVIPEGRVLDEHGWVVGENDTYLSDFCQLSKHRLSRVNRIFKLKSPRRLKGRTLNLCTASAPFNYYHYVIEALGRYPLVIDAGFRWDDFDHILMPRYQSAMSAEIDRAIGVPVDRVIRMKRHEQFICDILGAAFLSRSQHPNSILARAILSDTLPNESGSCASPDFSESRRPAQTHQPSGDRNAVGGAWI